MCIVIIELLLGLWGEGGSHDPTMILLLLGRGGSHG